jgi:uncharacterized protein
MAKVIHISWARYGKMADMMVKKIKGKRYKFDLVIGIARGGIPLAMVISDRLGVRIDLINVKSYYKSSYGTRGKRTKPRIISTISSSLEGKRVLLVDDLIEEGDTMRLLRGYIEGMHPSTIKTAVFFRKPWSRFEPDFYIRTVDRWVVFPWEMGEFRRSGR